MGGILITSLYRTHLEESRVRLRETAQSNARFIEAVAAFDRRFSVEDDPGGPFAATLSQVRDAHRGYEGFGNTGEFTLARLEADQIVFLLSHRHMDLDDPAPIPISSTLAEPQRRALSGESGTMIGLDYRGERVLAAYEPVGVPGLTLGIVAKIDLSEVRRPFLLAALWGVGGSLLLILLGVVVFQRIGQPLVRHLAESEQMFRGVFQGANDGMMMTDPVTGRFTLANSTICTMLGRGEEEIRELGIEDIVPKNALPYVMDQFEQQVRGEITSSEEIPLQRKDGSVFFADVSSANIEWSGRSHLLGIFRDVTVRKRAEDALRESEERYRTLVEEMNDGFAIRDGEGILTFVNRRFCTMLGWSRDEIEGHHVTDFLDEQSRELLAANWARRTPGDSTPYELTWTAKDGRKIVTIVSPAAIHAAEDEGVPSYASVITDITERKQAEEALRESENRFRAIFDHAGDGLLLADVETMKFTMANQTLCRMLDRSEEEIRELGVMDIHPEEDLPYVREQFQRQAKGEILIAPEIPVLRSDGSVFYADIASSSIVLGGRPHLLGVVRDVTARMETEAKLALSDEILRSVKELVLVANEDGDMTYVSPSSEVLLGYPPEELLGDGWWELSYPDPEDRVRDKEFEARRARGEEPIAEVPYDRLFVRKDGSERWIRWRESSGPGNTLVGLGADVTEQREAEEALLDSRDRLRKLAGRLDEVREVERNLLARELHDAVGQALTAMRWDLDMLEEELPEGQEALAHRIHSMIDITNDAVSRVNRLSHELRSPVLELLGLEAAIGAHAEEVQERTGVGVEWDIDLGDLEARSERDEVALRIFQESLSNVLRHAKASNVWVRLRVEGEDVVLEVLDDGIGISDEQLQDSGSFGLIGMRERAVRLGGRVEIRQRREGGTEVRASIPIEPANGG